MNKVTVKIANQEYTIVGDEKREYLLQIAAHVDEQIELTSKANPKLSQVMTTVLTSINIADEYYSEVKKNLENKKLIDEPIRELEEVKNKLNDLEQVISHKDEEIQKRDSKIEALKVFLNQKEEEIIQLKSEHEEIEERLKESEEIANDFQNRIYDLQMKLVELEDKQPK